VGHLEWADHLEWVDHRGWCSMNPALGGFLANVGMFLAGQLFKDRPPLRQKAKPVAGETTPFQTPPPGARQLTGMFPAGGGTWVPPIGPSRVGAFNARQQAASNLYGV